MAQGTTAGYQRSARMGGQARTSRSWSASRVDEVHHQHGSLSSQRASTRAGTSHPPSGGCGGHAGGLGEGVE
eukprot:4388425-Pyramimonas_sp.AAC.4